VSCLVRVDAATKALTLIAGADSIGFDGDGGPASKAALGVTVEDMVFDAQNRLYLVDSGNFRIRRITFSPLDRTPRLTSAIVNAAALAAGPLAPLTWTSVFGAFLASGTVVAESTDAMTLGGTSVIVTDSQGVSRPAQLQFVSDSRINFLVPEGTALGSGSLRIQTSNGASSALAINGGRLRRVCFPPRGMGREWRRRLRRARTMKIAA